jgi:hypothetical protein
MNTVLGFKLGRRLIAAAGLRDEEFVFGDQRFVTSRPESLESAMTRYFETLLEQVRPDLVFYYAPAATGTTASRLLSLLESAAAQRQLSVRSVSKTDVFDNFGILPLRTKRELREHLVAFWAALADGKVAKQGVLAEAASAAMNGEMLHAIGGS